MIKKLCCFSLFIFVIPGMLNTIYSQPRTPFQNYKIFPSSVNQIEPVIVRHPLNSQIMFASSYTLNTTNSVRNEGIYITTNGGSNWFGFDVVPDGLVAFHNGDPGPVIDKNGNFILTHLGPAVSINRIYSNVSTNTGANWSNPVTVYNTSNSIDKGYAVTDDVPASTYYGRTYASATMLAGNVPIATAFTTSGGLNWQGIYYANNSVSGRNSFGPSMSVSHTGTVYVVWASTIITSPFNEVAVGFSYSTNGGVNWNAQETAYQVNGVKTSNFQPWGIRINGYPSMDVDKTGGARNGWIYVVTGEKNLAPAGSDPDIIFRRSTNGGTTWSSGIRVNQDALNNGKIQYFPCMHVDDGGGINILYYDTRNSPSNDSVDIYISRSSDGGNTWNDFLISNSKFYPQPVALGGAGNQGDNIGMTSANGKLWPVWMAKYPGDNVYQIWTAPVNISDIGIRKISSDIPSDFELLQNYPNPFNPSTKIIYKVSRNSHVSVKLYDVTGRELFTLVEGIHTQGVYETELTPEMSSKLSGGYYFYRLNAGNGNVLTGKMVFLK